LTGIHWKQGSKTRPPENVTEAWIPNTLKDAVVGHFDDAFKTTSLQTRGPWTTATVARFGLHDDSFAYSTLDGTANGGVTTEWFFWPKVESASYTNFWESSAMGGELRPELQSTIFTDDYPTSTEYHQDFDLCVNVTHATYMLNAYIFIEDGTGPSADEIEKAKVASADMGYSFQVTLVEVAMSVATESMVDILVTVAQTGAAPFYYPLALTLDCTGMTQHKKFGVETIVVEGDSREFSFVDVPASSECLGQVGIGLFSPHAYPEKQVEFAQGDGTKVLVTLPLPPTSSQPSRDSSSFVPTLAATTTAPTTVAPVTAVPTTAVPTTTDPTTAAPTTAVPTSLAPISTAPTTVAPITEDPTTASPTTTLHTTAVPTTAAPNTVVPNTTAPTTVAPTTLAPTTAAPITSAPTVIVPITLAPTTITPTSAIVCGGLSKRKCAEYAACAYGKKKLKYCIPKEGKEHECSKYQRKSQCNKKPYCKHESGFCVHECDGLSKRKCKKKTKPDSDTKICSFIKETNPCQKCNPITCT